MPFAKNPAMIRLIVFIFLAPSSALAADGPSLISTQRVDRIVAGGGVVAARVGPRVELFNGDGSRIGKIGGDDDPSVLTGSDEQIADRQRAERIFDLLGVAPEDRETTEAEDMLEDEKTLNARRASSARRTPDGTTPSRARPLLAAAPDGIYVVDGSHVIHVARDLPPIRRSTLNRADVRDVAVANNGMVALLYPDALSFSDDGGSSFMAVSPPAPGTTRIVLSPTGQTLATAALRTIQVTRTGRAPMNVSTEQRIRDLALCDDDTLAVLTAEALHLFPLASATNNPPPQPVAPAEASRIICGPPDAATPWLLVAPDLLAPSSGHSGFRRFAGLAGVRILDATSVPGERSAPLWVATDAGLLMFPSINHLENRSLTSQMTPAWPPQTSPHNAATSLARLLPRVVIQASARGAPGARDYRALVYANFPLGQSAARPPLTVRPTSSVAFANIEGASASPSLPPMDVNCLRDIRRQAVALSLTEPDRAHSYVTRAARAAWLPELLLRVNRRLGRRESLDVGQASTSASDLGLDTANDVRYEARATWDLARLVFSPEEISAQNQALRMADMRRDLEAQIDRLFFERRRLLIASGAENGSASALRQIRREEVEAGLDALSDGAFSRCSTPPPPNPL